MPARVFPAPKLPPPSPPRGGPAEPHPTGRRLSPPSPHACASKAGRTLNLPASELPPPSPPRGGPAATLGSGGPGATRPTHRALVPPRTPQGHAGKAGRALKWSHPHPTPGPRLNPASLLGGSRAQPTARPRAYAPRTPSRALAKPDARSSFSRPQNPTTLASPRGAGCNALDPGHKSSASGQEKKAGG
jgi:hypothetical protein